jgi:hypothetical protein
VLLGALALHRSNIHRDDGAGAEKLGELHRVKAKAADPVPRQNSVPTLDLRVGVGSGDGMIVGRVSSAAVFDHGSSVRVAGGVGAQ